MNAFPWTIFIILILCGLFGTLAVLPYALSINPQAMEKLKAMRDAPAEPGKKPKKLPPTPVLILISGLQSTLLVAISSFLGLLASRQVGLGLPVLQAALNGQPVGGLIAAQLPESMLLGLLSGAIIMALEAFYFMERIPRQLANLDQRTAFWKRVLACFYGGIVEEILLRLFVMSGLVWLLGLIWKDAAGAPAAGAFWAANILAALLFGAGHLPASAQAAPLTPMVVIRALVLNGIPGVVFGYLFMRYGLEAAMLAHFSLDILIHLAVTPFMQKRASKLAPQAG